MSITNIEEFKSRLITGGARPTLFRIENPFPSHLGADATDLSYMAKAASIPEEIISPISVGYFGRKIKLAGDRTYRDWNLTIINDEMYSIRTVFETWHNLLNSPAENVRDLSFLNPLIYKTDLVVRQLSQSGFQPQIYKLIGAFPIRIGDIKLSWDDQNTIEEFDVTFAYDYFLSGGVNTASAAAPLRVNAAPRRGNTDGDPGGPGGLGPGRVTDTRGMGSWFGGGPGGV